METAARFPAARPTVCQYYFFLGLEAIIDVVEQKELRNADPEELGLSNLELHLWYFETCLEVPLPDNLNQYLEKFDFADRHEFERMMMYQFIHWSDSQAC